MSIFPDLISKLPEADLAIPGAHIYISQAADHQVVFMEFEQDAQMPLHAHASQWEHVVAGKVELTIDGKPHTFVTGDSFFIPEGVSHGGKIHAGYASFAYFQDKQRYTPK